MIDPAAISMPAAALLTAISPEGRFLRVAPGLARALGAPSEELVGRELLSLVPAAERGPVQAALRGLTAGEPSAFEARMAWGGAAPRWTSWEVVLTAPGGVILGTARDVDAERAAATTLTLLEAILDKLSLAVACSDEQGDFRFVNRPYAHHYGYPREAMLGRPFTMVIPEAQRERWMAWHRRVISGAVEPGRDAQVVDRGGRVHYVRVTADRVELPGGERFRLTTIADVSERRRAQQTEQLLRSVLASAPMVIWAADAARRLALLEGRDLVGRGIQGDALLGRPVDELHTDPAVQDAIRRAYAGEEIAERFELHGRVFDICLVPLAAGEVETHISGPRSIRAEAEPAVETVFGVEWDVTDEVRAAEELRAQLELIEAQRATIRRLAIPIVPVGEGALCVPLVGEIDRERAQALLEDLLGRIVRDGAGRALIDLTGVEGADAATIAHLMKVARAARLLGAEVVLTGIRPAVARALVEAGLDLGGVSARATLQEALARRAPRGR